MWLGSEKHTSLTAVGKHCLACSPESRLWWRDQSAECIRGALSFPCSSLDKQSACSAGDLGSIPGLGRSPGEGNGNPLHYPCLENLMDRGAWWAVVYGVAKSQA